jgi:hypothetical protein
VLRAVQVAAPEDVVRWARDLAEDEAGELEREPACKQHQDCQDDQDYNDPEEQPRVGKLPGLAEWRPPIRLVRC